MSASCIDSTPTAITRTRCPEIRCHPLHIPVNPSTASKTGTLTRLNALPFIAERVSALRTVQYPKTHQVVHHFKCRLYPACTIVSPVEGWSLERLLRYYATLSSSAMFYILVVALSCFDICYEMYHIILAAKKFVDEIG